MYFVCVYDVCCNVWCGYMVCMLYVVCACVVCGVCMWYVACVYVVYGACAWYVVCVNG